MNVGSVVFAVACLMFAFSLLMPIARKLQLPYTVLLGAFGVVLGLTAIRFSGIDGVVGDMLRATAGLDLPSDGYLFIFLPPLLFSAGLSIDVRRLMDEVGAVIVLAVVAVVVCTGLVGFSLSVFAGVPLAVALLLGSIVATTDSAAVVAIFRDLGAPKRLLVLVEGESLFNDAAAIALYTVLFSFVAGSSDPAAGITAFFTGTIGGAFVGYIFAKSGALIIGAMKDLVMGEVTLTVALAYLTYYVADTYLGVSGVIAVVTAAIVFANDGRLRVSPGGWSVVEGTWKMLDFWATSLIFVLAAMVAPRVLGAFRMEDVLILAILFGATLVARVIILYAFIPVLSRFGLSQPIEGSYRAVLAWGGLRGAVTIALALAISEDPSLSEELRRFILVAATGYVLITLFIQAPTLHPLMRLLRLDKLTPRERQIRDRVMDVSRARVQRQVNDIADEIGFPPPDESHSDVSGTNRTLTMEREDLLQVALLSVASREMDLYLEYYQRGIATRRIAETLRADASRTFDGAKTDGFEGYGNAVAVGLKWGWQLRTALWTQRRFGFESDLARLLAWRFEVLIVAEFAVRDLITFSKDSVSGLVGPEIVKDVEALLEDRLQGILGALEAVSLQFPSFASDLHQRYLKRIALGLEETQYKEQLRQSVISLEVFEDLELDRRGRQSRQVKSSGLNLGLELSRMLAAVPLFSILSSKDLERIARQLRPGLSLPGEKIIERGRIGTRMFFIAAGSVKVKLPNTTVELGAGDYFGEMALVTHNRRNADVIADGFCHLLVLDRRDFRRLMRTNAALQAHIVETTATRLKQDAELGLSEDARS
jgi:CPA1 family monovalent cation:H+ antiporter